MKIQKASEDFTEGGIMFPSSKTSYIEENASTSEEKTSTSQITYFSAQAHHRGS